MRCLITGYHCQASQASRRTPISSLQIRELALFNQTQLLPSSGTAAGSWVWSDDQQSSRPNESHPRTVRCRQLTEASTAYTKVSDNSNPNNQRPLTRQRPRSRKRLFPSPTSHKHPESKKSLHSAYSRSQHHSSYRPSLAIQSLHSRTQYSQASRIFPGYVRALVGCRRNR